MVDISIAELPAIADQHDFNTPMRRKMLDIVGWAVVLLLLFVGYSGCTSK